MNDLRYKDVINLQDGCRLGCVTDIEVDVCTARVISLIIYGRYRLFGLLGREDDIIIGWCNIEVIGEDTILVNYDCPPRKRGKLFGLWGKS